MMKNDKEKYLPLFISGGFLLGAIGGLVLFSLYGDLGISLSVGVGLGLSIGSLSYLLFSAKK